MPLSKIETYFSFVLYNSSNCIPFFFGKVPVLFCEFSGTKDSVYLTSRTHLVCQMYFFLVKSLILQLIFYEKCGCSKSRLMGLSNNNDNNNNKMYLFHPLKSVTNVTESEVYKS